MNIKDYINKNPALSVLAWAIHSCRKPEAQELVQHRHDPAFLYFQHWGVQNPDKDLYLIKIPEVVIGFYAMLNATLAHLAFADRFHLTPVVEFQHSCLYTSTSPTLNSLNTFEQFFLPVSNTSIAEVYQSASVNVCRFCYDGTDRLPFSYLLTEKQIDEYARMYKKYIHLRPELDTKINNDIQMLLEQRHALGVHVRKTDFYKLLPGHPIPIRTEQYYEAVDEGLNKTEAKIIFLATDDQATIFDFKKRYGNRVVYYKDTIRSTDNKPIHESYRDNREDASYQNGVDVLRDGLTLAACESLVGGPSQVSIAARICKKSNGQSYRYCRILNNGLAPLV